MSDAYKVGIIIQALLSGLTVEIDGMKYCMDTEYYLCVRGRNETRNEDILLRVSFGGLLLSEFVNLALKATPETLASVVKEATLYLLNQEESQK